MRGRFDGTPGDELDTCTFLSCAHRGDSELLFLLSIMGFFIFVLVFLIIIPITRAILFFLKIQFRLFRSCFFSASCSVLASFSLGFIYPSLAFGIYICIQSPCSTYHHSI
jgi:hypothetical protein